MSDPLAPAHDLAVFIGRFQPFHRGHLHVVRAGLTHARRLLIVIGSQGAARRPDMTPFTAQERARMILASLEPAERERVIVEAVPDFGNLTLWAEAVQGCAAQVQAQSGGGGRVTLVGCSKDRSSYYLRAFPQWDAVPVSVYEGLSATHVREAFFDADPATVDAFLAGDAARQLPAPVIAWLQDFRRTAAYADMVQEWAFALDYRAAWAAAPYPPVFVTADAVVIQGAHVLLIRRRSRPGRGLWALPGGFVERDEYVVDAALRELEEETGLGIGEEELRRSLVATRVFDAPFRDIRGRMITHATLFHLDPRSGRLPGAKGADDAAEAAWVPLDQLRRDEMFDDHYVVVETMKRLIVAAG